MIIDSEKRGVTKFGKKDFFKTWKWAWYKMLTQHKGLEKKVTLSFFGARFR